MNYDELWPGGPRFRQTEGSFRLSTDSVLLGSFASDIRARNIFDLGCGAGILPILLHVSHPSAVIGGIEIQPRSAELCRGNLSDNGMDPERIITGDLREYRGILSAGAYDLVVSNPPYFAADSGYTAPDTARAAARDERSCTLADICSAASFLTRWGGAFCMVHRPERLSEIFCTLTASGLEPKRLRMVQHREGAAPNLVLVESRRGGKPGLKICAPLILCDRDGSDSEEIKQIYHRG